MGETPDVGAAVDAGTVAPAVLDTTISTSEAAGGSVTPPEPADDLAEITQMLDGDPRKEAFLQRLTSQRENLSQAHQRELAEIQERYSQFEGIDPWLTPLAQLAEMGFTPELLAQQAQAYQTRIQGQSPQPGGNGQQPQTDPFAEWVVKQGMDPDYLTESETALARQNFTLDQRLAQFERLQSQQEQQNIEAQLSAAMTSVQTQMPMFKDPRLEASLFATFSQVSEGNPKITLQQVAGQMNAVIQDQIRNALASTAAAKQTDAVVPVTAGGSAPAPTTLPNIHSMDPQKRSDAMAEYLRTIM